MEQFFYIIPKQFVCPIFRDNTRIDSLLELVGLGERRVIPNIDFHDLKTIDYNKVNKKMDVVKKTTKDFLDSFLSNKQSL